jgi:probable H4MPT-linked C1 transfer pathway protein
MTVWFGWDIGGPHLKLARVADGALTDVRQVPCALWQGLDRLTAAFEAATKGLGPADRHAVTMTGEMVDLFPDRPTGVRAILRVLVERFGADRLMVYGTRDGLVPWASAYEDPAPIASANWHATAALAARRIGTGLLVDIGSTTADLIPLVGGKVAAQGLTDLDRLANRELVYTGCARTPLMALARTVPFDGRSVGVAAEYYATMADVYRLLGRLPDGADQHPAADNRGKSVPESRARLARMIGCDAALAPDEAWSTLAAVFAERQLAELAEAAGQLLSDSPLPAEAPLVGAGVGRFIVRDLAGRLNRPYRDLAELIDASPIVAEAAAQAAPAVAVALLASA